MWSQKPPETISEVVNFTIFFGKHMITTHNYCNYDSKQLKLRVLKAHTITLVCICFIP